MSDLRLGDVVRLRSGGPPMTVSELLNEEDAQDDNLDVKCIWFCGATAYEKWFNGLGLVKQ